MHSITHGGANCNILRRIFARMRERRGILSPFAALCEPAAACASPPPKGSQPSQGSRRAPPRPCGSRRAAKSGAARLAFSPAAAPLQGRAGAAAPPKAARRVWLFSRRRAHAGAAAGSGGMERRRGGAAAGALKSWRWRERGDGNEKRVGGGGKKEEAFGKIAERFVWGLICFAARVLE